MEDTVDSGEILTLVQAARILGYHQDYLGQLARSGKLQAQKIGRNWVTTRSSIKQFLLERQKQGASLTGPEDTIAAGQKHRPTRTHATIISMVQELPVELRSKQVLVETDETISVVGPMVTSTLQLASAFEFTESAGTVWAQPELRILDQETIARLYQSFAAPNARTYPVIAGGALLFVLGLVLGMAVASYDLSQWFFGDGLAVTVINYR